MLNVARSKPVVAIAASLLTVALIGGTAVAARLITSEDIKDETIRERDLKPSLVDRINRRGPRGRAGAPGFMPTRITASDTGPTQTWDAWSDACGATQGEMAFVNGIDQTPPLGTGAFQVTGGPSGYGAVSTEDYDGAVVGDLSTLRFSERSSHATDHPYVYLNLDNTGDGQADRTIYFIAANNADQGATRANAWQTWNAVDGLWNDGSDTGPTEADPLSEFATDEILGVRIAAGCGAVDGTWQIDAVEIGVDDESPAVFDFERN